MIVSTLARTYMHTHIRTHARTRAQIQVEQGSKYRTAMEKIQEASGLEATDAPSPRKVAVCNTHVYAWACLAACLGLLWLFSHCFFKVVRFFF
jgi:hypothetical protein